MNPHAPSGQQSAQRLGQGERGRLGDRVSRNDRQGGKGRIRQDVDDGSAGTGQQRQEGLDHVVGAVEVDGEVLFERGTVAEVIVKRQAGVIDEDVEGPHALGSRLRLRRAGHVQNQRRDPPVGMGQRLPGAGIHPLHATLQGFLD